MTKGAQATDPSSADAHGVGAVAAGGGVCGEGRQDAFVQAVIAVPGRQQLGITTA
ncbi:hypothetical protein ACIGJO_29595 [Streptomyces sp. NPDC079020]|uniref:hypothetical protein n=1 Tax=Streptomyces sp. NPDC079020 TaxID=3365722 RepID=UPI0037CDAB57